NAWDRVDGQRDESVPAGVKRMRDQLAADKRRQTQAGATFGEEEDEAEPLTHEEIPGAMKALLAKHNDKIEAAMQTAPGRDRQWIEDIHDELRRLPEDDDAQEHASKLRHILGLATTEGPGYWTTAEQHAMGGLRDFLQARANGNNPSLESRRFVRAIFSDGSPRRSLAESRDLSRCLMGEQRRPAGSAKSFAESILR